jgi:hypothetical protein
MEWLPPFQQGRPRLSIRNQRKQLWPKEASFPTALIWQQMRSQFGPAHLLLKAETEQADLHSHLHFDRKILDKSKKQSKATPLSPIRRALRDSLNNARLRRRCHLTGPDKTPGEGRKHRLGGGFVRACNEPRPFGRGCARWARFRRTSSLSRSRRTATRSRPTVRCATNCCAQEFGSAQEARVLAWECRRDYNHVQPYSSLGYRTPIE